MRRLPVVLAFATTLLLPATALSATALSATALSATALSATALSAAASPAATGRTAASAGPGVADLGPLLRAMERDLRLSPDRARERLAADAAARTAEAGLRARLGTAYGGAWTQADGTLAVGVTSARHAPTVRGAGARPVVVGRSAAELDGVKTRLDRRADHAGTAVHAWYTDPATNAVVVVADDAAAARAFSAGVPAADRDAVRVVTTAAAAPRPLYDVRGGDQYVINARTLCSIGFSVRGGFVTAGHCGGAGSTTAGYNNVAQGTVQRASFPGDDHAWVATNGSWTPQPWVNNYAGGNVPVAGSQEAGIGSSVCRSGRTTGWRCGVIEAKNVTVNYSNGPVYGLTQTNACAEGGDSGGSWITGDQAQGITSGGSGNCSTGGRTFFQPVNEALSVYGLSLVTTGGGSSTGSIVGFGNRCIDVPNANAVDGQFLQMWDCNGTAAQSWTFGADGTVRAMGMCMDVAWGSRDNGAVIQLAGCSGNPAQQFVLSAAGDLVNPQANKCVDVGGWDPNNGARLILWDCHGGANQKWRRG